MACTSIILLFLLFHSCTCRDEAGDFSISCHRNATELSLIFFLLFHNCICRDEAGDFSISCHRNATELSLIFFLLFHSCTSRDEAGDFSISCHRNATELSVTSYCFTVVPVGMRLVTSQSHVTVTLQSYLLLPTVSQLYL